MVIPVQTQLGGNFQKTNELSPGVIRRQYTYANKQKIEAKNHR